MRPNTGETLTGDEPNEPTPQKRYTAEDILALDVEKATDESTALIEKIRPLLRGAHPGVQGTVLAELLGTWLAGHNPDIRAAALASHVDSVRAYADLFAPLVWKGVST